MAIPTWETLLDNSVKVIDDPTDVPASITPANPALMIPLSAFSSTILNQAASLDSPEKVMAALLKKFNAFNLVNQAEDNYVEVTTRDPQLAKRNGMNFYAFDFAATVYSRTVDTIVLDPDLIDQLPA